MSNEAVIVKGEGAGTGFRGQRAHPFGAVVWLTGCLRLM
jgi:hypothetical protein